MQFCPFPKKPFYFLASPRSVTAWLGWGQVGHGPSSGIFEEAPRFQKGAKKFMKFDCLYVCMYDFAIKVKYKYLKRKEI